MFGPMPILCVYYLALDVFKEPIKASWNYESYFYDRVKQYQFGLYATRNWGLHAAGDPENSPEVQRAIISSFASQGRRNAVAQLESRDCRFYSMNQTLLHVIAQAGLATICSLLLKRQLTWINMYMHTARLYF